MPEPDAVPFSSREVLTQLHRERWIRSLLHPMHSTLTTYEEIELLWIVTAWVKTWLPVLSLRAMVLLE